MAASASEIDAPMTVNENPVADELPDSVTEHVGFKAGFSKGTEVFGQRGGMVERIAGGVMSVAVVAIVLNELFTLDIVNSSTGPFSSLLTQVENIGTAALGLVVLGFLAAAAGLVLTQFRGGF